MSNGQRDNTKTPIKWSITQRLQTDLGRSVRVTTATKLVWLISLRVQRGCNKVLRLSVLSRSKNERGWHVCVRLAWIRIWGVKWNVVCPSVCFTSIPIWGVTRNSFVCLSYLDPNMRDEMKRRGWNAFFGLSKIPQWGVKWNCPSSLDPRITGEMKRSFSFCPSW